MFYKKEVSTKLTILKTSALPENVKQSTMIQEVMRRMSNTDRETSQNERNNILEEYIETLRISGYRKEEVRKNFVDALKGYAAGNSQNQLKTE